MKDLTKYKWNGKLYGKSRLIEAIVTDYIVTNNILTPNKAKEVFSKGLNGKYEVVENAKLIPKNKLNRYFTDSYIILADGNALLITNQWGIANVDNIFTLFKHLGYKFRKTK